MGTAVGNIATPVTQPMTGWIARLNALTRAPTAPERCELCGIALPSRHAHLVEPATRALWCACTGCSLLFEPEAARRFKRIPSYAMQLQGAALGDADWQGLGVPIEVAFFFESSTEGRAVGLYPGAAGLVEADIDAAAWERLKRAHPHFAALAPDVEALLVNRLHGARECFRMPIDRCYELAALVRRHWRGMSGGTRVWQQLAAFFAQLRLELAGPHGRA